MGFDLKEFLNLNNKQKQQNQPRPASTAMPQKTLPQFNMQMNNLSQPQNQPQPATTVKPAFKPFDNSLTRGLSRGYDQVNPFDNNRTWQQTVPTNTKSTWQQGGQLGGQIVRGTAPGIIKSVNTAKAGAGGLLGLGEIGLSSVFGSDQDYQNTLNNVNNTLKRDLAPNSGAFGLGTAFKDYNEALNATPLDIAKKSVRYGVQDYLEGASLFTGAPVGDAIVEKGILQGVKSQIPNLAKSALLNTAQGGVTAFNQGAGRKDILKNAALSGVLGTTGDLGMGIVGAYAKKAIKPAISSVTTSLVDKTKLKPLNEGGFIQLPGGRREVVTGKPSSFPDFARDVELGKISDNVEIVPRSSLKKGPGTSGIGLDEKRINQYTRMILKDKSIAPMITDPSGKLVNDGQNRLAAFARAGITDVPIVRETPKKPIVGAALQSKLAKEASITPQVGKTQLNGNDLMNEFSKMRKQYGNDAEFFDKVVLNNQEAPGMIGELSRSIARTDAREGGKNYTISQILDDHLTPTEQVANSNINLSNTLTDLKQTARKLERDTGQKGLYDSLAKNMAGMNEKQQIAYLSKGLSDARDAGAMAASHIGVRATETPSTPAPQVGKTAQFETIKKLNPMTNEYNTGIRSVEDIKTYKEAFNDPESFVYPDYSKADAQKALTSGKVTIYSSKPLDSNNGQFVTPSKMQASDYAGSGKVYSKEVNIKDVAWINGDEGQLTGSKITAQAPQVGKTEQTWYHGTRKLNEGKGDTFYSGSKEVAGDYSIMDVGDKPNISVAKNTDLPKKPLRVMDKQELADEMGYKGDPFNQPKGMAGADLFDTQAKAYAQSKGYDSIHYQEGSFGEPELHAFEKTSRPKLSKTLEPKRSLFKDEGGFVKLPGKTPKQEVPIVGQNLSRSSKVKPGEVVQTENIQLSGKSKVVPDSSVMSPHELNVNKFNITQKGKKALSEIQTGLKEQIESVRGEKLTNQEVRQHMEASRTILKDPKTRTATKDYIAGLQNLREDNAALLNKRGSGSLTIEESTRLNTGLLKQYQAAADAGRTLRAFREVADPRERTVLDMMIKKIASTDANMKEVKIALDKLGPNSTPKEQAEFYRTFVKATKEDWLDKYRYTNMLSSPLTHIVNTSSNIAGVFGVAPVQRLYEGFTDTARSALTGGPRTRFAGEAGSYIKGSTKAIPDALRNFRDVMLDKKITGNPDMDSLRNIPLATRGPKATADKVLSFVPKLLEAGDQFATTLSRGGEEAGLLKRAAKGVKVDVSPESLSKMTDDAARYRLFRQELNKQGQGHLLDAIDIPAQTISKMRQSKNPYVRNISKFTIPFVATPTNIFKQGIEYSPLGVFTLHGNIDKTTQVAKILMGTTTIGTAVGALGVGGNITFGEPTDSNQRNAFRAEGKQAYSFKLPGSDKWINYSKMHPAISMNLAIVGAVKDAQDKGSLSDSDAEKIMNTGAGIINYFTDQSYMKNVGDFVNILSGKDNVSSGSVISSTATNNINQLVPFKSLVSWVGRQVDPTQRKISSKDPAWLQTYQGVVKDIPVLNKDINTRKDPYTGQDLKNPLPVFNSFSPNKVSIDKGFGNTTGLNLDQRQQNRDLPVNQREPFRRNVIEQKAIEKQTTLEKTTMESGKSVSTKSNNQTQVGGVTDGNIKQLSNGKFYAQVDGKYTSYDTKEKAQKAINVSNFKSSNEKKKLVGDTYYLKNDSEQGYTTVKKNEYDFNQNDSRINLEMDRAKSSGNVNAWLDSAQKRYEGYNELLKSYDPETEQDKINNLTKKMEDLKDQANTYKDYGGFNKGKTKSNKYNFAKIMTTGVGSSSELRNIVKSSKIVRKKVKR